VRDRVSPVHEPALLDGPVTDPQIEGASPEQLEILREILAGLGSARITGVVVREFDPGHEGDLPPPPGPYGDEIVVATPPGDNRGRWEAGLLARSFVRRSQSAGLTRVASFGYAGGATGLDSVRPAAAPLDADAIVRLRAEVAAAPGEATLEGIDVLQPQGHAFAIAVRVDEPHAFLRSESRTFLTCLSEWREQCDGIYAEIRDADPSPAMTVGWFQGAGFSSWRGEVECCAPFLGLSRGISWQGPPPCPVFGEAKRSS
jgi:hypothetical protein